MEYFVDPETLHREAEREKQSKTEPPDGVSVCTGSDANYCISTVQGATLDDDYYLIEAQPQDSSFPMGLDDPTGGMHFDVNALASKLATLEGNQEVEPGGRGLAGVERRVSTGSERVGRTELMEKVLEGGGVFKVPVRVEKHGTAIVWEFSTEPKGIAFGICYKESQESTKEEEVRVREK